MKAHFEVVDVLCIKHFHQNVHGLLSQGRDALVADQLLEDLWVNDAAERRLGVGLIEPWVL
jgi:hypothetical protein